MHLFFSPNCNSFYKISLLIFLVLGLKDIHAQDESEANTPSSIKTLAAEGATLPSRVMRARAVISSVSSSKTFDKDGNKIDSGLNLKATSGAFVFEYGILDALSL